MKYMTLKLIEEKPDDVIEIDPKRVVPFTTFATAPTYLPDPVIEARSRGLFAGRALFLDNRYDWHIGTDGDATLLVCTTKEGR